MDFVWIGFNYKIYNESVRKIQNEGINIKMVPAILAYLLLVINILYILIPCTKSMNASERSRVFFISGLVIYGVYNTTTLAILKNYSSNVAVLDTLWGGVSHLILSFMINYYLKN